MTAPRFSRRRLMSALLVTLFAWLCPRPRRAAATAAPRRCVLPASWWPSKCDGVITYTYDARGGLSGVAEHSPCRAESRPCSPVTLGQVTIYSYDRGAPG